MGGPGAGECMQECDREMEQQLFAGIQEMEKQPELRAEES